MSELKNEARSFVTRAILAGALGAAVMFSFSLFLQKKWQVSGKIVVFPSGKPASASQNLSEEIGNTAWIVNSDTFQKRNFGDLTADFAGAEVLKNSSIVLVKFRSAENNIQAVEDLIAKIPSQVDEYARDLYEGSPFKYKIVSDPEISKSPVSPDVVRYSEWGALAGLLVFLAYWIFFEFLRSKKEEDEAQGKVSYPVPAKIVSPKIEEVEPEKTPVPAKQKQSVEQKEMDKAAAEVLQGSVPPNLPVAETEKPAARIPEAGERQEFGFEEPTDEEIKERLNRLMRGEL